MHEDESTPPLHALDEGAALRMIVEGTAAETGERSFRAWCKNLARALDTHGAWVTEYLPGARKLRALAFWLGGEWVAGLRDAIDGTPCEEVVDGAPARAHPRQRPRALPQTIPTCNAWAR